MLNSKIKKEAIANLEFSVGLYDKYVNQVQDCSLNLYNTRKSSRENVISPVEQFINSLANTPKELDRTFSEYNAEFEIFNKYVEHLNNTSQEAKIKAGTSTAGAVATGAGVAALMPSAAMAIATTFGTASTGTAIASLSGAAATNAALAWLGGGALTAGGAGMAGGTAFLALAGPIGIGIGVVGLIGGGLFASSKNKEIAEKANSKTKEIEIGIKRLKASKIEIKELIDLTLQHQKGISDLLTDLLLSSPYDYMDFSNEDKSKLASLINHIESLSKLLNKKVV